MHALIPRKRWIYAGPVVLLGLILGSLMALRVPVPAKASGMPPPAPLPQGSLVLMEDRLSLGVDVSVVPVRTSFSLRDNEPAVGQNYMRLSLYPKAVSSMILDFRKAWQSSGIPNPGDMGQFLGGALVFYIRTRTPGELFEVGFAMSEETSPETGGAPTHRISSLPVRLYCWTGPQWQKVIIPLDHFSKQGYIWAQPQPTGKEGVGYDPNNNLGPGMAMGRPTRIARSFNWHRVAALTLRGTKVRRLNRLIDLDQVAIVPHYDKKEMKQLMLEAARRELMARQSRDYVIFGDEVEGTFWSWPGGLYTYVNLDEVVYREGKKSAHFVMQSYQSASYKSAQSNMEVQTAESGFSSGPPSAGQGPPQGADIQITFAMMGISIPEMDLSTIFEDGGLSFWVRGKNGGEHFQLGLTCVKNFIYEANLVNGPDTRAYIEMKVEWQKVIIPLRDFPRVAQYTDESRVGRRTDFEWKRVTNIFFYTRPPDEAEWQWHIDDLRFIPRLPKKLVQKTKTEEADFIFATAFEILTLSN